LPDELNPDPPTFPNLSVLSARSAVKFPQRKRKAQRGTVGKRPRLEALRPADADGRPNRFMENSRIASPISITTQRNAFADGNLPRASYKTVARLSRFAQFAEQTGLSPF
jgi:hypothetical protein